MDAPRQTKYLVSGLALAGGAVVATIRLRRSRTGRPAVVDHAATVVSEPDAVRRAWLEVDRLPTLLSQSPPDNPAAPPRELTGNQDLRLRTVLMPAPGGRGTEIRVRAEGAAARKMSGPLREELRRLKAIIECDESVTVVGQPSGRGPASSRVQEEVNRLLRQGGLG